MWSRIEEPIAVFYSYHEHDRNVLKRLETFLSVLKRQRSIVTWYEGLVCAGGSKAQEVADHWKQAQIILLLVSSSYLADDTCYEQMEEAMARAGQGQGYVLPILVSPSSWQDTPIKDVQTLPKDKLPLSLSKPRDLAYVEIATEVGHIVTLLREQHDQRSSSLSDDDEFAQVCAVGDVLPPHKHSSFLQREEYVHELYETLTQPECTALVLTGLAGIGKSTLAAQLYAYAEQQRQAGNGYFTAEPLWLVVTPALTLLALIEKIALAAGIVLRDSGKLQPEELALRLFHLLERLQGRRLIVLDGFETYLDGLDGRVQAEYDGIAEWLDLLNGAGCASKIVLTTRIMPRGKRIARQMYMQNVHVAGLTEQEGLQLLQLWKTRATEKDLLHVVQLCKGHPLALVLLDGLLQSRHMQLSQLLENQSYQRLWHNNIEQNLFDDLYKSMPVLERHLLLACSIYRKVFSWPALCAVILGQRHISEGRLHLSFEVLLSLSFLHVRLPTEEQVPALSVLSFADMEQERSIDQDDVYYQLHPLVVDFAYKRIVSEKRFDQRKAHSDAAKYYRQQVDVFKVEKKGRSMELQALIESIWHFCQAEQWASGYALLQQEQLFIELRRRGAYAILLELADQFVQADAWQPEPEITALLLIEMGVTYHALGKHAEAQYRFESALETARVAGLSAIQVKTLNRLGAMYRVAGSVERALACYHEANAINNSIGDTQEIAEQGITYNNMGRALQDMALKAATEKERHNLYQQGLDYYQQALIIHRQVHEQLEEAQTLNNIGEINARLQHVEEAESAYQQALQLQRHLGEKREEGIVCNNLGTLYRSKECYQDAYMWYYQALQIFRSVGARWDEGVVLRNLGSLFLFMQRNDLALSCFLLARDLYEELHQPERGAITRSMQAMLAGEQPFEQVVARIAPQAAHLLETALASVFSSEKERQ